MPSYGIGTRSYTEIAAEAKKQLAYSLGVSTLAPYGNLDLQTSVMSNAISQTNQSIENGFNAGFLASASGPWLDAKAADYGITREIVSVSSVSKESGTFKLVTKDGTSILSSLGLSNRVFTLPKGLVISATTSQFRKIFFTTTESTPVLYNSTAVCFSAIAELSNNQLVPAETYNSIGLDRVPALSGKDLSNLQFIQVNPIQGIQRLESDESLRYRISTRLTAQTGPNQSMVTALAASKADIARVEIIPNTRGTGSVDVVLFPSRDRVPQSVISFVQNSIESVKSWGSNVLVKQPTYVPVSMEIKTQTTSGQVRSIIETLVSDTRTRALDFKIITDLLLNSGISSKVSRLTIDGRDRHTIPIVITNMTGPAGVTLLPHEVFELKPRIPSEPAISVVQ